MIRKIADLPIKSKLLLVVLFPNLISLLFVSVLLLILELDEFKKSAVEDLSAVASVIANRSSAALLYDDKAVAKENLSVIQTFLEVQVACIYDVDNHIFAQLLQSHNNLTCPESVADKTTRFKKTQLSIVKKILFEGEKIGTVYIYADLKEAFWQKIQFVSILLLGLVCVSVLVFILSSQLLRFISSPIKRLVSAVKVITASQNYALRATKENDDEIGVLVDAFNSLIDTVEKQNIIVLQAKNRYLTIYDSNPSMMFSINVLGNILSVNQTCADQLGLTIRELQEHSIFDFIYTIDIPVMGTFIEHCLLNPTQVQKQEFRQMNCQGDISWLRVSAKPVIYEDQEQTLLLVCEDITEARELAENIAYQASHDALTGLANRSEFDLYIRQAIESVYTDNLEHVLCYLDLDQFKIINDSYGHLAGDELLRQLGDLLKEQIREQDFIARLGGDEFGILMYDCSVDQAYTLCEHLRDVIKDFRFYWENKTLSVGVSMGLSVINKLSRSAVNLLKEADSACYAAKDKGRNRVHIYSPDDQELVLRQGEMRWVEKIQRGLENQQFRLYGQLIVPITEEEEGLHFETLIRYQNEAGKIVSPSSFLPAAERYGLASKLDRWVVGSLFEFIATTPNFMDELAVCSVNLSGLSFSDETMLPFIFKQFDKWGIPTHKICFEVTETAAIASLSFAIRFINTLKEHGCLFSLDDFGSGLSSFGYLKSLPVDFLKIDGLFIRDILEDKVNLAMVKSINDVGHIMGKKTIAEFVENEEIFNLLNELGVDYAQGYGIGKPTLLSELKLVKPFRY